MIVPCLILTTTLASWTDNSQQLSTLTVGPSTVILESTRDRQRLIVAETMTDGRTRDLTPTMRVIVDDPAVARWDEQNSVLIPVTSGETRARVLVADRESVVPVRVQGVASQASEWDEPIRFRLDVLPVLMKLGCNSGRCHGAARGKDGFRLSLFGYDPTGDYHRLTREFPGRRINLAQPEESLMLRKATGAVVHTGGKLTDPADRTYQILAQWIAAGAPQDPSDIASPESITIFPPRLVLNGPGEVQRLLVQARYSDGTDRDVTDLALYLSNNDATAKVDGHGVVTSDRGGEAFVMARFATFTVGIPVIVLDETIDQPVTPLPAHNYIDERVAAKLARMRISPSELCGDAEFLRRVSIDLIGLLPTPEETEAFLADPDPGKREALIDALLAREEFIDLWAMKWGELLKVRTANQVSYKALLKYHNWFRERLKANVPFDAIVRDLIRATGGTFENPATNFYQLETNTLLLAEDVAQVFMGIRVQCAQCHNHPFDRWTMDDYYGFAAFFGRVGFKQSPDPREFIIYDRPEGEIRHIVDQRVVRPRFLGGGDVPDEALDQDRRAVLADWIASPQNPLFARHLANLIWAQYFGRGIIEPVDDVRVSNPPSNPELLDALTRRLVEARYDIKVLVRDIVTSRTYQLSTRTNPGNAEDQANFSHALIRRIRSEVLLDNISRVTGTIDRFDRLPPGTRATQIVDGQTTNYFLTTFGRATRARSTFSPTCPRPSTCSTVTPPPARSRKGVSWASCSSKARA
jgi:hypothetical protein